MDTSIINSARAAKKAAWRRELHGWFNEWARAQEWAAQTNIITEKEMDRLAEIVDGLIWEQEEASEININSQSILI